MTNVAPYPDPEPTTDQEKDYLFDLLGYRILRQALSPAQLKWIDKWIETNPPKPAGEWIGHVEMHGYGEHDGANYQNIIEGGTVFEELIDSPTWIDDIRRYIPSPSINEALLNLRVSGGYIGLHGGGHLPNFVAVTRHHTGGWLVGQINIFIALTDIGPGDGATVIVPGSHKSHNIHPMLFDGTRLYGHRDDRPASDALMTAEVYLKAGDALMFTDGLAHGSTARTNPGQRRNMIYRYSPDNMATRFHYIPSDELMERLTPERRKFIQPVPPRFAPGRVLTSAGKPS